MTPSPSLSVRPLVAGDRAWTDDVLRRTWGSTAVARKGELIDAAGLPGFVATADGDIAGLLTYAVRDDGLEVVTIHADPEGRGVGRALMDAVRCRADELAVGRIWLITTNDNVRALRFYQQWGMDLVALHRGGVEASRAVKPTIPSVGQHRIPVRHELELELRLPRIDAARGVDGQAPVDFQK